MLADYPPSIHKATYTPNWCYHSSRLRMVKGSFGSECSAKRSRIQKTGRCVVRMLAVSGGSSSINFNFRGITKNSDGHMIALLLKQRAKLAKILHF
jgi:hypothetical protein